MSLHRCSAVIFDLDGTLTLPQHDFDAIRHALDIPQGALILEHIATLSPSLAARKRNELEAIERDIASEAEPAAGLYELLDHLQAKALPRAILTRNSRDNALISLAAIDALHYFADTLIIGRDEAAPKPHPAGIELLARRIGKPPKACAMIGDYRHDLAAGRAAGCYTVHLQHPDGDAWPELTDLRVTELKAITRRLTQEVPDGQ